jgi:hypothetical protein
MIGAENTRMSRKPRHVEMTLWQAREMAQNNIIQYVSDPTMNQRMLAFPGYLPADFGKRGTTQLTAERFELNVAETLDQENKIVWQIVDRNHSLAAIEEMFQNRPFRPTVQIQMNTTPLKHKVVFERPSDFRPAYFLLAKTIFILFLSIN